MKLLELPEEDATSEGATHFQSASHPEALWLEEFRQAIDDLDPLTKDIAVPIVKGALSDVIVFVQGASGLRLRDYQRLVVQTVIDSVLNKRGDTIVVMFPRQSGKNELQAQIEAYLLTLYAHAKRQAEIVKVSPTWKPQSQNAMRRLERVLTANRLTRDIWRKESGYIYRLDGARIYFLSGAPEANIVGATASTLLECDEAQDVLTAKWDKDISPMAASTNATRVFWGTAWTGATLLARELRLALEAEQADGRQRVFRISADEVAREVAGYRMYVEREIARLGRQHPLIKSQYFSEEIEAECGMFPPARLALLQGTHARQHGPTPGKLYAFLLDVAGEDESGGMPGQELEGGLRNPGRDSTALTVVEVDLNTLADDLLSAPTYWIVERALWTGVRHTALYGKLRGLGELWRPRWWVVDATGVGAGLASFLERAFPGQIIPFTFNAASKSKLGWDFLTVVETGRLKDWISDPLGLDEAALFRRQAAACQMEVQPGADQRLKWGVPDGRRDPATDELVHDDLLLSAALCAVLDALPWGPSHSAIIPAADPLARLSFESFGEGS